jgi:hypothetical protein
VNDLPRREPTPLYPRPGRFEDTLRRARKRRQRSAVLAAAALVVVCAGGVSAAMATRGGHHGIDSADVNTSAPTIGGGSGHTPGNGPSVGVPSGGAHTSPGNSGSGPGTGHSTPPTKPTDRPSTNGSGGSSGNSHSGQLIRGKAVDAAGQPLSDIGVYVKSGGALQKVGETKPDGSYQIPCTNSQVLLASGDFAAAGSAGSQQNYAYTYVDSPGGSCTTPASSEQSMGTTVMDTGGQLSVTVIDASGNPIPGSTEPALFCDATSSAPCYTMVADDSGHYTYSGLATGDYTLRGDYGSQLYHVTAGQTTNVTWVEGQPPSSPTAPSSSAPPSTPTDTPTSDSQSPAGTTPQSQTTPAQ